MTWQPIETAPKRDAILICDGGTVYLAIYVAEEGWQDASSGFELTPTHWMPLPEPPR